MGQTVRVTTYVEADGGARLAVHEAGTGPAVVLLHGWPVTSFHWRSTVPALVEAGFRTVAVDLRGLGESSAGTGGFTKEELADDVMTVADHLGLGRFAVVGHDWGGTLGCLAAADHPDRIGALVVEEELLPGVDVAVPEPGNSHYPSWHGPFNREEGLAEALVPGREDAYYGMFLRRSAGPEPLAEDVVRVYVDAYRRQSCAAAGLAYYRTARADADAVRSRTRKQLTLPVLAIGGRFAMGTAVRDCLREVALHVEDLQVADAGHYPAEQSPGTVNPALVSFLREHHPEVARGSYRQAAGRLNRRSGWARWRAAP